jgi:hypothetical protein
MGCNPSYMFESSGEFEKNSDTQAPLSGIPTQMMTLQLLKSFHFCLKTFL